MFDFLFKRKKKHQEKKETPKGKHFQFLIVDTKAEIVKNKWYRLSHWKSQHFLKMDCDWDKDWKSAISEEEVVGVSYDNRAQKFVILGDQEDFQIFLEREPENPQDPNAIKVMGRATINGENVVEQLGYLSKETALYLKDEKEIDARPYSVYLPYEGRLFGLRIRILVRKAAYKKKHNL